MIYSTSTNKAAFFLLLALIFPLSPLIAQTSVLKGKVTDSLEQPVPYVNILAAPLNNGTSMTFAITDVQGRYKLELLNDLDYKVTISHLGFSKQIDTIGISQSGTKDFILNENTERLGEVVIETELAVVVKQDTITYRTDQFKTGEERKLRDVLEKLPGVEVDRQGNVSVNGKKVTKFLVEGKTFFTGDTKLGVNNIPADVVDEVVALDNYNEVAFLKGLSDSDQLALNIKLKEGKEKFLFGDIEAGVGPEERFSLQPTLFYYSPKTAANVIGDFNNIGEKSFTLRDYINFEGGMEALKDNPGVMSDIFNSDFARFLNHDEFIYHKNDFLAGSISHQFSFKTRLDAYTIMSKSKFETRATDEISYHTGNRLDELRETTSSKEIFFILNKLKLRFQPNRDSDFFYEAVVKTSTGDNYNKIFSQSTENIYHTRSHEIPEGVDVIQNLSLNRQFSLKHTSTLGAQYRISEIDNRNVWLFDRPIFSDLIPFIEEDVYHLLQNSETNSHYLNVNFKHYWVLTNRIHLYPSIGVDYLLQTYSSQDYQELQNGGINQFHESGFNNKVSYPFIDLYSGFELKVKKGKFVFKPGLMFHRYQWSVKQFDMEHSNFKKSVLLPKLEVDWTLNSAEKFELSYSLENEFASVLQISNRLRLSGYNQLYQGNAALEHEIFHSANLNYRKFSMYRGIFLNGNISFTKKLENIQNTTMLEGIDRIIHPEYFDLPESNYRITGSVAKKLGNYRFNIRANMSVSDYSRSINEDIQEFLNRTVGYQLKAETFFEKWPNFELGVRQRFNRFASEVSTTEFMAVDPFAIINYDFLNDFILKADYAYSFYKNRSTSEMNRFQMGNVSLFYNKKNSSWSLELDVQNVFDVKYKKSNSFSQFFVRDQRTYIQPRTVMLKVAYKL